MASHPSFQAGDVHTGFIDQHFDSLFPPITVSGQTIAQAVVALITNESNAELRNSQQQNNLSSPFTMCDTFRLNSIAQREIKMQSNGKDYKVQLKQVGSKYELKINDSDWKTCSVQAVNDGNDNRFTLKLNLDGVQSTFCAVIAQKTVDVFNEVK